MNNPDWKYKMTDKCGKDVTVEEVKQEKDLWIIFQNSLKFHENINRDASKPNRITGCIKRSFSFLDKPTFVTYINC